MKIEFRLQINALTLLVALNFIIFFLAVVVQSTLGFDSNFFYIFGGLDVHRVYSGSYWLLITSAFFHLEIIHFLLNIYALYKIGQAVANYYSDRVLMITYIFGALGGSLLSYFISFFGGGNLYSLGASGAIFALLGLLVGGSLKRSRYGVDLPFSIWDILPAVLFSLWFGFIPGSQINNWAHIGGLLTGIVLGMIIKHSVGSYKSKFDKGLEKALYFISLILLIGSSLALIYNAIMIIFIS